MQIIVNNETGRVQNRADTGGELPSPVEGERAVILPPTIDEFFEQINLATGLDQTGLIYLLADGAVPEGAWEVWSSGYLFAVFAPEPEPLDNLTDALVEIASDKGKRKNQAITFADIESAKEKLKGSPRER